MQLQYAYVLKQLLPLTIDSPTEWADIELETGVRTRSGTNNIDILLKGRSPAGEIKIGIELKCYRTIAASGGTRGADDIFMMYVYEDLHILEEYVNTCIVSQGVALVMNGLPSFVEPKMKIGKCWAYDISNGYTFAGGKISVPVGGKSVNIDLKKLSHSTGKSLEACGLSNLRACFLPKLLLAVNAAVNMRNAIRQPPTEFDTSTPAVVR